MTTYTPTTLEQCVTSLGYSPLTSSMLLDAIREYTTPDRNKWDVLDGIKAVIDRKPQDFGTQFEERVQEALSYTPDPFAPY